METIEPNLKLLVLYENLNFKSNLQVVVLFDTFMTVYGYGAVDTVLLVSESSLFTTVACIACVYSIYAFCIRM